MNNFMLSKSKYCLRGILKNRYQTQNIACVAFWKIKALLFNENNYGLAGRSLVVEIASGFIEPVLLTPFFSSLFFDFDFDRIDEFWSESTNFGQLFVFKSLMSNGCLNANNWPKFGEKFYPYHMIILSASILNFNVAAIMQRSDRWKLINKRRLPACGFPSFLDPLLFQNSSTKIPYKSYFKKRGSVPSWCTLGSAVLHKFFLRNGSI